VSDPNPLSTKRCNQRRHPQWLALLPVLELGAAVLAGALWYAQGGAVWYAGDWPGPWPLLLLALLWLCRLLYLRVAPRDTSVATSPTARLTPFSLPLLLFTLSAAVSLWAAYDPARAWAKAWLIVGALGLYWALSHQPTRQHLYLALSFWGVFGVVLTAYFFVTTDWSAHTVKVPALVALGQAISAQLPHLTAHRISPNVFGGMLAVTLPFYLPLILLPGTEVLPLAPGWRRALRLFWSVALAVALLGWLVASSRGAWLALTGAGALWALWRALEPWTRFGRRGRRRSTRAWSLRLTWMGGFLLLGAALAGFAVALILEGYLPGAGALTNRLDLLRTSALLARDTPFTGIGLGMYEMHFSIYTLLIHVGYIVNSHNLLLDLAIEQGVPGALAYAAAVAVAFVVGLRLLRSAFVTRHAPQAHTWIIEAALVALLVGLAHGMVDDILYGSRALLLLFVPFGVLATYGGAAATRGTAAAGVATSSSEDAAAPLPETESPPAVAPPPPSEHHHHHSHSRRQPRSWRLPALLTGLLIPVILTLTLGRGIWSANLGAIAQARVELNVYDQHHFDDPPMDEVRRQEDLSAAIATFERALAADSGALTARQRLTSIALARRDYATALALMQGAWDAGHRDAVTRLLYGDVLVAHGRVEEAVAIVRGIEFAQSRLLGQISVRYHPVQDATREAYARQAAAALAP